MLLPPPRRLSLELQLHTAGRDEDRPAAAGAAAEAAVAAVAPGCWRGREWPKQRLLRQLQTAVPLPGGQQCQDGAVEALPVIVLMRTEALAQPCRRPQHGTDVRTARDGGEQHEMTPDGQQHPALHLHLHLHHFGGTQAHGAPQPGTHRPVTT